MKFDEALDKILNEADPVPAGAPVAPAPGTAAPAAAAATAAVAEPMYDIWVLVDAKNNIIWKQAFSVEDKQNLRVQKRFTNIPKAQLDNRLKGLQSTSPK